MSRKGKALAYLLGGNSALEGQQLREWFFAQAPELQEFSLLGLAQLRARLPEDHSLANVLAEIYVVLGIELPKSDPRRLQRSLLSLMPGAAKEIRQWTQYEKLPNEALAPCSLNDTDLEQLRKVFSDILPRQFAAEFASESSAAYQRPVQWQIAEKIAATLGGENLLLLDAPTGTGKTLAYLVPALLWSARSGVRVGVSTYTRALQEQAYTRELPRALRALAAAGVTTNFRTCLLKGKNNYICWRQLKNYFPDKDEPAEELLAWLLLARYCLTHTAGDLDQLPYPPHRLFPQGREVAEHLQRCARHVACARGCCSQWEDKKHCGFELAKKRAERAHLVITNHAFVFAVPDFFKHLIFDESEHLHQQAISSETVEFRPTILERQLKDLSHGKENSRAPLDQFRGRTNLLFAEWGPRAPEVLNAWEKTQAALDQFYFALEEFEDWRIEEAQKRNPTQAHSLLKEFAQDPEAGQFVKTRDALAAHGAELTEKLEQLLTDLLTASMPGALGIRTRLERSKSELERSLEHLCAALPTDAGRFSFVQGFFYDLERDNLTKSSPNFVRRILLPDLWLQKFYWPTLRNAVMLSATAYLHGGFEATARYLGLDQIQPTENSPRILETFKAPDPFDYSRVFFAIPSDAPRFHASRHARDAFLNYVANFIVELCRKTRGRCLVLFTSAEDLRVIAKQVKPLFAQEQLPLWYQGMPGIPKEQLADQFRETPNSTLFGLDTFWYGVDFAGEICENVVLVKLPYGQMDRYYFAQRSELGEENHYKRIYLPRALSMFRQGFGRLMRRQEDRGAVFLLDKRVLEGRHRHFFREVPGIGGEGEEQQINMLIAPTKQCLEKMGAFVIEMIPHHSDNKLGRSEVCYRNDAGSFR